MTKIGFSDGIEFDTSGSLRIETRSDGLYVVGQGLLCACETREEAEQLLLDLSSRLDEKGGTE